MKLELDMYSLIYITTLYSEYLYVRKMRHIIKKEKEEIEKSKLEKLKYNPESIEWLEGFEKELGKRIPRRLAVKLSNERRAFDSKIEEVVKAE